MKQIHHPVKLHTMRVRRTYTGGKLLDQMQGIVPGADGSYPEEWVASTITSRFDADPNAGLSIIDDGGETRRYLKDLISSDPSGYLGEAHVDRYGESLGFLAKLIDSDKRLNIQTHPDNEKAKEYFGSEFGKTEAWYIIDTRIIDGQDPFIYLGFKSGIRKEQWIHWIETQDRDALEQSLHRIPVKRGEVFLVESGMPHAIGTGCFLAEIQEPTDYTFRVERMMNGSEPYPEEVYHQGIGYEKMYECFHYDGYSLEELLAKTKIPSEITSRSAGHTLFSLLNREHIRRFGLDRLLVTEACELPPQTTFQTAVVLSGSGSLVHGDEEIEIGKSNELFLPASRLPSRWVSDGTEPLEVLICKPPVL